MDWFKLWRLKRARHKVSASFANDLKNTNDWQERQQISQSEGWELSEYDDAIAMLRTQDLLDKARARDIPISYEEEYWNRSTESGGKFLTTEGRAKLRDAIRGDGRQRRDIIRDIILTITAIISVLSFINSFRKK